MGILGQWSRYAARIVLSILLARSLLARTPVPNMPSPIPRLNIPGPQDEAVEEYCAWLQSRVTKPNLGLIHWNLDPKYLMDEGVKRGVAEHVVGDIDEWVQKHKRARTEE